MSTINSGMVMRLLPRTVFDFTLHTNAGGSIRFPIAQHIDVSVFQEAVFIIRLHSGTVCNVANGFTFNVLYDGYDFDDPATVFSQINLPGGASPIGNLQVGTPATVPFVQHIPVGTNFGRFLMLQLQVIGVAGGTGTLITSVDLALKGGDPNDMAISPNTFRGYRLQ